LEVDVARLKLLPGSDAFGQGVMNQVRRIKISEGGNQEPYGGTHPFRNDPLAWVELCRRANEIAGIV